MPTNPKPCVIPEEVPFDMDFPVIDAVATIDIYVSPQDILEATRKDRGCCALAKAFARSLGAISMNIMGTRCQVLKPSEDGSLREWSRYTFGTKTKRFVQDFDAGIPVQPGLYTMQAPRPSERLNSTTKAERARKARARAKLGITKPQSKRKRKTLVNSATRNFTGKNAHKWKTAKTVVARKAKKVSPKK